ncbi:MAG: DUF2851 family protein [Actinobacteria bacterium]|nr:DUF2851 family protein [Actinomycetota bacterium]
MPIPASEADLVAWWLACATRLGPFRDSLGREIEIVYPGRWSRLPGPDIVDAILVVDRGRTERGALEVHLDEGAWLRHGHHHDPAYRAVVLHVVWSALAERRDALPPCVALAGRFAALPPIETLTLDWAPQTFPCQAPDAQPGARAHALHRMIAHQGLLRHVRQADAFEGEIAVHGEDQALYRAVMGALGYRANAAAFAELAEHAPYHRIQRVRSDAEAPRTVRLEAFLLGSAGLLPSQRGVRGGGAHVEHVERLWRALQPAVAMRAERWTFRSVRPANWPPRRVAAAAHLLRRFGAEAETFAQALLTEVLRAADTRSVDGLAAWFAVTVPPDEFWASRFDFGRMAARPTTGLVGPVRALEVLVNVGLPFAAAVACTRGRPDLALASAAILERLGAGGTNEYTRYMAELLGVAAKTARTAAAQQGLLGLYHGWCRTKDCRTCPAGALTAPRASATAAAR